MAKITEDLAQVEPGYLSIKAAALWLGEVTTWSMQQILDSGSVVSVYYGKRRLVDFQSLKDYARNLPRTKT